MPKSCGKILLLRAAMIVIVSSSSSALTPSTSHSTTSRTTSLLPSSTALFLAKKNTSRRKQQNDVTVKSKSGGTGFGVASSSSSSSTSSSNLQMQGKVRTLSGFSGSGTKPLRQAANTFDAIREQYGAEASWDVYVKSPLDDPDRLWFVGKVACVPNTASASPELAVASQKRIILEYAKRELRPQNLGLPKYADTLEVWLAPGDSEMDCVQNKVSLWQVRESLKDLLAKNPDFSIQDVGYNPEIYVGDEREKGGLRITRDANGDPIKPPFEINA